MIPRSVVRAALRLARAEQACKPQPFATRYDRYDGFTVTEHRYHEPNGSTRVERVFNPQLACQDCGHPPDEDFHHCWRCGGRVGLQITAPRSGPVPEHRGDRHQADDGERQTQQSLSRVLNDVHSCSHGR